MWCIYDWNRLLKKEGQGLGSIHQLLIGWRLNGCFWVTVIKRWSLQAFLYKLTSYKLQALFKIEHTVCRDYLFLVRSIFAICLENRWISVSWWLKSKYVTFFLCSVNQCKYCCSFLLFHCLKFKVVMLMCAIASS